MQWVASKVSNNKNSKNKTYTADSCSRVFSLTNTRTAQTWTVHASSQSRRCAFTLQALSRDGRADSVS